MNEIPSSIPPILTYSPKSMSIPRPSSLPTGVVGEGGVRFEKVMAELIPPSSRDWEEARGIVPGNNPEINTTPLENDTELLTKVSNKPLESSEPHNNVPWYMAPGSLAVMKPLVMNNSVPVSSAMGYRIYSGAVQEAQNRTGKPAVVPGADRVDLQF